MVKKIVEEEMPDKAPIQIDDDAEQRHRAPTTSPRARSSEKLGWTPQPTDRGRGARPLPRLQGRQVAGQHPDRPDVTSTSRPSRSARAEMSNPGSPSSPAGRVHRQPHGRSAARPRLPGPRASTTWSAAGWRTWPSITTRTASCESTNATCASSTPGDPLFAGRDFVFHFAGIGDIVPSIERPIEYMSTNVMGTVHVLEAARHAGVQKFVYAASSSCYGLAAELPTTRGRPDSPAVSLRAEQVPGRAGGASLGQGLPPAGRSRSASSTPTARASRTTGAYGAVFGVFLAQKLAGKPFTVVGDGTQRRDFVYVTDVARAFLLAAESEPDRRRSSTSAPATRSRSTGWSSCSAARSSTCPSGPGEPDCTWADITKITRELGWKPAVSLRGGRGEHARATSTTGGRRRCGTPPRSRRRRRPGFELSGEAETARLTDDATKTTIAGRSRPATSCAP